MAGKDERDGIASATNPMRNLHFDVDGRYGWDFSGHF